MDGYERMVVQRQVARPAQATYDLKHTKEKKARHQYKSGMCGVVMVVQDAMNYADKWKQCCQREDKAGTPLDAPAIETAVTSPSDPQAACLHPETTVTPPSDPPPARSDPPTPGGVLSDPPHQTALLSDWDLPIPDNSYRVSDLDVLNAALARIRSAPLSLDRRSPRK
ncbi:hypothetical protein OH76DRAFT_1486337 [Lentinus brumalis]|uniref:Uncharacterized protein n=1 Tax=Lentinus brumalis TaxID=2498619 RepID=A0A371CYZ5_9APHY|nr:hypothetical protein OH76DRAFT_1486337 [Polyporus brumalis]